MQYRIDNRGGNKLSALGFGCMRFPMNLAKTDMEKTEKMLVEAVNSGINYFDTAYVYPDSERAVGEIFEKCGLRDKVFLATKLPQFRCNTAEDFDKYFDEQKARLRTSWFDYYLLHCFTDFAQWERLKKLGIQDWIARKKESGEVRQLGFSFHGSLTEFKKLIDDYDWDFTQIQYNYLNVNYQAGKAGLDYAAAKGIPVIIMEPLLGGKLANVPAEAGKIFKSANPAISPVGWSLNWLWNQPEVMTILSGMSTMEQLQENIQLADASRVDMLSKQDLQAVNDVVEVFNKTYKVPCTGCNYCMPCPRGISIPDCFAAYNASYVSGLFKGVQQYMTTVGVNTTTPHFVTDCTECGACVKQCPQHINVPQELKRVKRRLQVPGSKKLIPWVMKKMK